MSQHYWGPDSDKVAMARLLSKLDSELAYTLEPAMKARVNSILSSHASATNELQRERDRELAKRAEIASVRDADVDIKGMKVSCQASVTDNYRNRTCSHYATVTRTWTTEAFDGLVLDGVRLEHGPDDSEWSSHYVVPGGWEIGKGFTSRPLTDEEHERAVRLYKTITHTVNLCGTHRNQKGSYGLPY